ncbi:D-alanyl-D-alanine carboxypeptidase/D-alanyl-D-alanine-endopeptidase [Pseudomonas aeruginosa]|nr:D-alanyl-D-alanine carboxypeptidase/D-alanyl-D-alanine-endopeptidase [Pseudomonas aeruginosa]
MFKSLRTLAFATLLPFALPTLAQVNATLPANVQKALQTNKLTGNDLSLVLIPLDGPGNPTYYNADVSVNPASTMKLFTTYAALEMLGPTYQWKTEFYTDNLKSVRMVVRTDGNKVNVQMDPPLANVRIDNQVKMTAPATCPAWPKLRFSPVTQFDGTTLLATGQIPQGCSAQTYMSLLDHPGYTAGAVRGIWQELGGSILGKDRQGSVPRNATLIAKAFSPDLVEIIRDINKYSNNTMARQLFLSIGAQFRNSADGDDAQAAQRVVRQWLARKGITAPRLVMENGSGLSRQERVSAREMAAMLQAAWHSPYAAEYISSLPLAGLDGTMRKRLRRTALVGEAHVKTGTLNTVRALAGFSRDASGHNWVVVAILNSPRPWGASAILDQVLLSLHARK